MGPIDREFQGAAGVHLVSRRLVGASLTAGSFFNDVRPEVPVGAATDTLKNSKSYIECIFHEAK